MSSKKRWGQGFICLVMVLALFIPLFPSTVNAAPVNSADQITSPGGIKYYDKDGKEVTASPVLGSNSVVSVSKTIRGTDIENEFLIDLEVKTSVDLSKVKLSPDAAVVLVLDTSGSMGPGYNDCIEDLKKSAISFLEDYSNVDKNTAARYAALVTYASDARINYSWVDVTNPANLTALKNTINGLKAEGGTFMQGGLLLARNLLRTDVMNTIKGKNNEVIGNRSVILFTDGAPTYSSSLNYVNNGTGATQNDTAGYAQGTLISYGRGTNDGNGSSGQSATIMNSIKERTETMAAMVKSGSSFTVKGNGSNTTSHAKLDAKLYTIGYGSGPDSTWLKNSIATGTSYAYDAKDAGSLNAAFDAITASIERWAQAWAVTDPMGANIEFIDTIASNDLASGILAFNNSTKTLQWNLQKVNPGAPVNSVYTYKYSYRIKLDNTTSNFAPNTPYATNGETVLNYVMVENNQTVGEILKAKFLVPAVKGFLANLNFAKVGSDGKALEGCLFQLDYGSVNKTGLFANATSAGTNGSVAFSKIPSGYKYTLKETQMPANLQNLYILNDETFTVTVSMGNVVITDSKGTVMPGNFSFVNQVKKIDFSFKKIDGIIFAADNKVVALNGAEFSVYKSITAGSENKYIPMTNGTLDPGTDWVLYTTAKSDGNGANEGNVTLSLEPGNYMLVETKAPIYKGVEYTLPTGQWALKVDNTSVTPVAVQDPNGQLPPAFISDGKGNYKLPNFRTQELPLTGGAGIAIFIGIGSVLLVLGTVLFIVNQKRNRSQRIAVRN